MGSRRFRCCGSHVRLLCKDEIIIKNKKIKTMPLFLILGLFCFLLVVGYLVTGGKDSLRFAIKGMVALAAIAFVGFLIVIIYAIFSH